MQAGWRINGSLEEFTNRLKRNLEKKDAIKCWAYFNQKREEFEARVIKYNEYDPYKIKIFVTPPPPISTDKIFFFILGKEEMLFKAKVDDHTDTSQMELVIEQKILSKEKRKNDRYDFSKKNSKVVLSVLSASTTEEIKFKSIAFDFGPHGLGFRIPVDESEHFAEGATILLHSIRGVKPYPEDRDKTLRGRIKYITSSSFDEKKGDFINRAGVQFEEEFPNVDGVLATL